MDLEQRIKYLEGELSVCKEKTIELAKENYKLIEELRLAESALRNSYAKQAFFIDGEAILHIRATPTQDGLMIDASKDYNLLEQVSERHAYAIKEFKQINTSNNMKSIFSSSSTSLNMYGLGVDNEE